jgi:hypothetical protein
MKKQAAAFLIPLLLLSCSESNNRVELGNQTTDFSQLMANSVPAIGQTLTSQEVQLLESKKYQEMNLECNFQKIETAKTVVKIEGDDIYVQETTSFTDLDDKSDVYCAKELPIERKLFKKSLKEEREKLSKWADENGNSCKDQCQTNTIVVNGKLIVQYSGIYNYEGVDAFIQGSLIPNAETPWLSSYLYSEQKVTIQQSNDSLVIKEDYSPSTLDNVDTSKIDFSDYDLEIYNDQSQEVTDEFLKDNGNAEFGDSSKENFITFKKNELIKQLVQVNKRTLLDGTVCFFKKTSNIRSIEKDARISRQKRLKEGTITVVLDGETSSFDTNRTAQADLAKCVNSPKLEDDKTTIYKFLNLNENGTIEFEPTRKSPGKIFSKL